MLITKYKLIICAYYISICIKNVGYFSNEQNEVYIVLIRNDSDLKKVLEWLSVETEKSDLHGRF